LQLSAPQVLPTGILQLWSNIRQQTRWRRRKSNPHRRCNRSSMEILYRAIRFNPKW